MFFTIPEVIPIPVPGIAARPSTMPSKLVCPLLSLLALVEDDGLIVMAGVILGTHLAGNTWRVVFGLFSFLGI